MVQGKTLSTFSAQGLGRIEKRQSAAKASDLPLVVAILTTVTAANPGAAGAGHADLAVKIILLLIAGRKGVYINAKYPSPAVAASMVPALSNAKLRMAPLGRPSDACNLITFPSASIRMSVWLVPNHIRPH